MSIATSADDLVEHSSSPISGVNVDCLIRDKIRIEYAGNDLSEESNGSLMELLRITNIAKGDLVEGIR
jgi:hypothetical protein